MDTWQDIGIYVTFKAIDGENQVLLVFSVPFMDSTPAVDLCL